MKITFLGHAGLFVETAGATILCDPWFNPAYFDSWFPFPDNSGLDVAALAEPTYLYLSHQHKDHFDRTFLSRHVSKKTTVLLPEFPLPLLRAELEEIGFERFVQTEEGTPVDLDGMRLSIFTATEPSDGPLGDSSLVIDDGYVRIFDQNDARPADLDGVLSLGPFEAHFLQFSCAVWYPAAYRFSPSEMTRLSERKRANQIRRAFDFIKAVDARTVVPSAGPPAFLDPELFHLNDFGEDPTSPYLDQPTFLAEMDIRGMPGGVLMLPGSVLEVTPGRDRLRHTLTAEEIRSIFTDKRGYLEAYQQRRQKELDLAKAALPAPSPGLVERLRARIEPIMALAPTVCSAIDERVLLSWQGPEVAGDQGAVLDFRQRKVYPAGNEEEPCEHRFFLAAPLLESVLARGVEDWVNDLWLSNRFRAERDGAYNDMLFAFFKCLSPERIAHLERWGVRRASSRASSREPSRHVGHTHERQSSPGEEEDERWYCAGYLVQRRCPHRKADLTRFGVEEDGVLTCTLHGWRFDLASGRCLTSPDLHLETEPADTEALGGRESLAQAIRR